jgi:XRE family transcriptional regulator, fatty acid utilization regulator
LQKENIRLMFGLKIKQLRQETGLSQSEFAQKSGISVSYLNEIEKGKKYPQTEKIVQLSESLGVSYDSLVSLKLHKKLAPIADLLKSNILQDLPLELFGIEPARLLEMLANAPTKVSAFVSTLVEISRGYDMQVEDFYFSVLRSYQELHENYFEDLEKEVENFRTQEIPHWNTIQTLEKLKLLQSILEKKYHYTLQEIIFEPALADMRSVLKDKTLFLNKTLSIEQKIFVLSREVGYQFMNIKKRSQTFSWVQVNSFDEVLNNFKASYFAGALLIEQNSFLEDIKIFFNQTTFQENFLLRLLHKYEVTPEMLFHRLTNLLPKYFGLHQLFFLRFDDANGNFNLTKEMHLAGLHNPHASALGEHYCRKWISFTILEDLKIAQQTSQTQEKLISKAQISEYYHSPNRYLVLALARAATPTPTNHSVAIGLKINDLLLKNIKFLNDKNIIIRKVGETCERCSAVDCNVRMMPAKVLDKKQRSEARKNALEKLQKEKE